MTVWDELSGGGNIPEATVEKDDGRTPVGFVIEIWREEKVGEEIAVFRLIVNVSGRCGEKLFIACFADHGRLRNDVHRCVLTDFFTVWRKACSKVRTIVHSFSMKRVFLMIFCVVVLVPATARANDDTKLVVHLKQVYNAWRNSMIAKNPNNWQRYTSQLRQTNVRNRLWSERRAFPQGVFNAPVSPPNIQTLKALRVRVNKNTAKSVYYGKVDFGVGGQPTDNVFVVSYLKERTGWKYDGGEFVNLNLLPKVREEIAKGDYKFVDSKDFIPDGIVPKLPIAITGMAKYIAKVYVFCPGREVRVTGNNGISSHLFQNTQGAEVLIGGARDGQNTLQYTVKDIPGGDPKSVLTIRLYLMSEVNGKKPLKPLEYQVENGGKPKAKGTMSFVLNREMAQYLKGK